MNQYDHKQLTCVNEFALKFNETPKKFTFNIQNKKLLEMSENGIVFNRVDFPDFTPGEFVEEFIAILEKTFCIKFINKFDNERGYLNENVTIEQHDHPTDSLSQTPDS